MKNYKWLLLLSCLILSTFSGYAIDRIEPVDIRSIGMGSRYYTDTETFYSLYNNPASIAFTGDKELWVPIVSAVTGGELLQAFELKDLLDVASTNTLDTNDVLGTLESYNSYLNDIKNFLGDDGYNASLKIGGPLTFGAIKNNFGWGFGNTWELGAKMNVNGDLVNFDIPETFEDIEDLLSSNTIPSIPQIDEAITIPIVATLDINTDFVLAYALPLDFGLLGTLSLGVSARGISQVSFLYKDDVKTIFMGDNPLDLLSLPLSASLGVGFDMGVQYRLFETIHVALVWQDFYSPVWTNTFGGVTGVLEGQGSGYQYSTLDPQLGLGASIDLPLEAITGNVISHSAVYVNYKDFLQLVRNAQSGDLFYKDPLLDLAIGAEVKLFDMLAIRVGMNQLFPSGGLGLNFGDFNLDASVHSEQLGYVGTDWRQLNFGVSVTFQ